MEIVEPLIEEINKITNYEYKFMLKSATLFEDADFCVLEIFYKDGTLIDKDLKQKVEDKIKEIAPSKFKYEVRFTKNFISEERVKEDIKLFMQKNFNSISFILNSVQRIELVFNISLTIDLLSYEHSLNKNLTGVIEKYLKNLYEDYTFTCTLQKDVVFKKDELDILKESYREEEIDEFKFRKIEYLNSIPHVNDPVEEQASYIVDMLEPQENVVLCGNVRNIKSIVIKRKPKTNQDDLNDKNDDKSTEETQALEADNSNQEAINNEASASDLEEPKYERKLYKWILEDFTGKMQCIFMSNKENQPKLEELNNDSVIAVRGKIQNDKFSNALTMNVHDIAYCTLPEHFEEYIEYHKEKPFYEFVKPEPIVIFKQENLLSFADQDLVPKYLQDKTFVCFDFETTGLHYDAGDRIVEVGAVKIVNGKITEKFVSFVNPDGKHISEGASATTGIYDEDVENAPKDFEVLQDFYKFTRGAVLIGYNNLNFDNVFLFGQAKKCRYNFDNPTEDVFRLAQKYVTGVKNYKLGTIAEKLGVVLDNAHSAVFDALATAEVFLKIAEKIEC